MVRFSLRIKKKKYTHWRRDCALMLSDFTSDALDCRCALLERFASLPHIRRTINIDPAAASGEIRVDGEVIEHWRR